MALIVPGGHHGIDCARAGTMALIVPGTMALCPGGHHGIDCARAGTMALIVPGHHGIDGGHHGIDCARAGTMALIRKEEKPLALSLQSPSLTPLRSDIGYPHPAQTSMADA
ncbi:hypothetical protein Bbelb_076790 [Branchiostoma belcheri]|nr:hypothetical protein Bbelb_076790 [Branchiostoma belcheri]